jgi:hypothetical protein
VYYKPNGYNCVEFVTGTYPAERLPQGQFRWTKKHATFALGVPSRYLVIRFHVRALRGTKRCGQQK